MKRFLFSVCSITILFILIVSLVLFTGKLHVDTSQKDFNIVLISIDALRADHLSCYGYERRTSPTIDNIAENGIIFKNAIAPSSWTVPSTASLFTSVYPINHGLIYGRLLYLDNFSNIYKGDQTNIRQVLSDELTTLTEILKMHGYNTFGVTSNILLDEKTGFARGFDYFKCLDFSSAPSVNETIYAWEDAIKKSDKFFIWMHYFDPHDPYYARTPWVTQYTSMALTQKLNFSEIPMTEIQYSIATFKKDRRALSNLIALYDSEINYVDSYLGELIKRFELEKNTLFIITADHGEEFLEHGTLLHGNNLYQETIHIPLIVKLPGSNKKELVEDNINLIDVMPTILDMLSIDPPEQTLGKSFWENKGLLFWLKKIFLRKNLLEYTFSELDIRSVAKTIITPEWKYTYNYRDKKEELYNSKSDPLELNNLIYEKKIWGNKLKEQLFKWVSNSKKYHTERKTFKLSPEEEERLKSMGYTN